ncbi:MAG: hypothetical protein WC807_16635 [Hyphomicrobium sp.]
MRHFILSAAIIAACLSVPARAEEPAKQEAVRIEADQAHKAFVFIIDDKLVAMLDKEGLHVVGGIDYGLGLTDTGPDGVKEKIASMTKEAEHE